MNKSVKNIAGAVAIAGVAAFAVAAQPAAAAPLAVDATVTENCDVTASPIAFGNVDSRSTDPTTQASTISVTCTSGTGYSVAADAGLGTGATITDRKMKSGSNLLNYALYTDAGRTVIWGDGTVTTGGTKLTGTGNGSAQTINYYGRVPGGQTTVPKGTYTDTVTVTVTAP